MTDIPRIKLRVDFLDGIRGWGALMVLLFHIMIRILGNTTPIYKSYYFNFITDGHLAVFAFFVLSGFALSITFIKRPQQVELVRALISRYLRLFIPVLLTSFIAYCLLKAHLIFSPQIEELSQAQVWLSNLYHFEASFLGLLKFCFFDTFFHHELPTSYNIVLWTMSTEYAGSILIYLSIGIFRQDQNKKYFLPLVAAALYLLKNNPSLSCFLWGYFLAEAYFQYSDKLRNLKLVGIVSTLLFCIPILISTFYKLKNDRYVALLAFVMVLSVTFSPLLQNFFSNRLSKFLGKISFPLYLIHIPIICSWSAYLFLQLSQSSYSHQMIANSILFSTLFLSIFCAWLISPVESFSLKTAKYMSEKMMIFAKTIMQKYQPTYQKLLLQWVKF